MKLIVAKVDEIFFDGEAASLSAPATEGMVTILSHHEPLVTLLKPGILTVTCNYGDKKIEIEGGVLEVHPGGATVLL